MAKKQDVTVVSDLVGRGKFTVSAKGSMVDGVLKGAVPSTSFEIEVTYKDQIEKMEYAVPTSIICLQGALRDEYLASGKFSFAPGTRIKVGANGRYFKPAPLPNKERIMQATFEQKLELLMGLGIEPTEEWLKTNRPQVVTDSVDEKVVTIDEDEPKYNEEELGKQSVAKLKVLAQNEELEGYDELTRAELVAELGAIKKVRS